jgi:hypothetical protein
MLERKQLREIWETIRSHDARIYHPDTGDEPIGYDTSRDEEMMVRLGRARTADELCDIIRCSLMETAIFPATLPLCH